MATIGVFAAIFDEQGRILCVKLNYGPRYWTTPGGRVESGESPIAALVREVREESGYIVRAGRLVGVYAKPFDDDLVLFMEAEVIGRDSWQPDGEIAALGFYGRDDLPQPMSARVLRRVLDAFDGRTGVLHVFEAE